MSYLAGIMLVASVAGTPNAAPPGLTHGAEIRLFASTMAIAQVASDRCPDILINMPMLTNIRDLLHILDEADSPELAEEGHSVASSSAAHSRAAALPRNGDLATRIPWCVPIQRDAERTRHADDLPLLAHYFEQRFK